MQNMLKKLILFLFCITYGLLKTNAQTLANFSGDYFLFIDHTTQQPVLILNDSTVYRGYDFKQSKLKNLTGSVPIKDLTSVKINGQTYVIDKGCGPVFKFIKDSFQRIDNTFRHRNQYGASVFVSNNKIYFFGGYGMFTLKNIVTYFDESTEEWFELPVNSSILPPPRTYAKKVLINNKLFVWGGSETDDAKVNETIVNSRIWVLDLNKNAWKKIGATENFINDYSISNYSFQAKNALYISTPDAFYKVDIEENKISKYESSLPNVLSCVYDPYSNNVIFVTKNHDDTNKNIYVKSLEELTQHAISEKPFFTSNNYNFYYWLVGLLTLLGCLFFIRKTFVNKLKQAERIVYNSTTNKFLYQKKVISLEKELSDLLLFFTHNQHDFVSLEKINDLFTNTITESHITINKRRDLAVKKLLFKLSTLLNESKNKILIERKSETDKRIKEIKLGIIIEVIS